jgi:hypothetical protein
MIEGSMHVMDGVRQSAVARDSRDMHNIGPASPAPRALPSSLVRTPDAHTAAPAVNMEGPPLIICSLCLSAAWVGWPSTYAAERPRERNPALRSSVSRDYY